MKILVFSDSHGNPANIMKAINMHPDASLILHAGDGIKDLELLNPSPTKVIFTNGNFEDAFFFEKHNSSSPVIEMGGKRIYLCHGHRQNVSHSLQRLIYTALENDADIAIFGHTHVKHSSYIPQSQLNCPSRQNGIYLFNPGSISRPRDGIYPSFGLIEIAENGVLLSHGFIDKKL